MKFGVCIPHYGRPIDVDSLTGMAVRAEQMGFDSVWVTDHIIVPHKIPGRGDIVYRHDMLEPLSLLTHLAAVTKSVNVGTSVIILPYRNPIILAKAIATADLLSKGRVIFGAAVGWMEGEFAALKAPFADRGKVGNEYLRLLKELWTNATPSFQGEYFQLSDVTVSPMPVQQPHPPIWIGGQKPPGSPAGRGLRGLLAPVPDGSRGAVQKRGVHAKILGLGGPRAPAQALLPCDLELWQCLRRGGAPAAARHWRRHNRGLGRLCRSGGGARDNGDRRGQLRRQRPGHGLFHQRGEAQGPRLICFNGPDHPAFK